MFKLDKETTAFVVIDIQEKLVKAMDADVLKKITDNTARLIKGANVLGVKTLVTQQYTKGLGATIPELAEHLKCEAIEKTSFSCCGELSFVDQLKTSGIDTVVLCGMETHVCVLQTALDLLQAGYNVHVVADAVCSRAKFNWKISLGLMEKAGAVVTVTETVLFQLVGGAGRDGFKEISGLIK